MAQSGSATKETGQVEPTADASMGKRTRKAAEKFDPSPDSAQKSATPSDWRECLKNSTTTSSVDGADSDRASPPFSRAATELETDGNGDGTQSAGDSENEREVEESSDDESDSSAVSVSTRCAV